MKLTLIDCRFGRHPKLVCIHWIRHVCFCCFPCSRYLRSPLLACDEPSLMRCSKLRIEAICINF